MAELLAPSTPSPISPPERSRGAVGWRTASVVATTVETPAVVSIAFEVPGWPGHRPGQHVDVRLTAEDGYQAQRSYSIASPPETPGVTLTVERLADGEVSSYLTGDLRPGDLIELRGPIGGYFTWTVADGGPLLLVAGGSGVVPLMAMLRHRAAAGPTAPATLLFSSRSWEQVIFGAELERLVAADPTLRVVHTLTRSPPPGWTGHRRRIDVDLLAEVAGPPEPGSIAFVCGPTLLVETVATDLLTLGYPAHRVKTERFGPSAG